MTQQAVFKILTQEQMDLLESDRFEGAPADKQDGYIHLSTADQLTETADRHFAGETDLWVAEMDLEVVGDQIRWEEAREGEKFPHLYGKMRLDSVIAYSPLERDEDGIVKLPVAG